jgi:hypothetical protein
MNSRRLLAWLLRIAGGFELLAFFSVVMPRSWMEATHAWLGMGEMASGPLVMFMIRKASFTYGMHGVSLWVLASDVVRFRALVILNGIAYLLAGPIFFLIDWTAGMPWWWTVADALGCGLAGVAILALSLTTKSDRKSNP